MTVRAALTVTLGIAVLAVGLAGLSAVVELPGERRVKEALGFDYQTYGAVGVCIEVAGNGSPGAWRSEPAMPTLRDEARAAVVGDAAYVVAGVGSTEPPAGRSVATVERFDFARRTWTRLPDLPIALNHVGIAEHDGDVYVLGGLGEANGQVTASGRSFRYDVATRRWEELPPMAEPRGGHAAVVVGDRIYVLGGRTSLVFGGRTSSVGLVEAFDTRAKRWSRVTTLPDPRDHVGAAAIGSDVYVFGGRRADGKVVARLDRLDVSTGAWTRLRDAPEATSGIALLAGPGYLYTAGGERPLEGQVLSGAWGFEPSVGEWFDLPRLARPLHGYAAAIHDGRVHVFGGSTCPGFSPTRAVTSLRLTSR